MLPFVIDSFCFNIAFNFSLFILYWSLTIINKIKHTHHIYLNIPFQTKVISKLSKRSHMKDWIQQVSPLIEKGSPQTTQNVLLGLMGPAWRKGRWTGLYLRRRVGRYCTEILAVCVQILGQRNNIQYHQQLEEDFNRHLEHFTKSRSN